MFSIHGLSTPNFIHGFTHLPGISAQLSMLVATFWLWLSSMPSDHAIVEFFSKRQRLLLPIWTVALMRFWINWNDESAYRGYYSNECSAFEFYVDNHRLIVKLHYDLSLLSIL